MVKMAAELLMDSEDGVLCGPGYGEGSAARGTIPLEVPKLRCRTHFLSLLERRRRAERTGISVVTQAYGEGFSTTRVCATRRHVTVRR
jgi:transposase-like protein